MRPRITPAFTSSGRTSPSTAAPSLTNLHILVISRHMPPATVTPAHKGGGTDTYMRSFLELTQRRPEMTFDVVALEPEGGGWTPPPGIRIHYVRFRALQALLHLFDVRFEAKIPIANLILLIAVSLALTLRALGPARRYRYDAIYGVGGPIAGLAAAALAGLLRVRAAIHFHWAYRFSATHPLMRIAACRFYERFAILIGNSKLLAADAAALGVCRTRLLTVYNWVDAKRFHPREDREQLRQQWQLPQNRFIFLYIGRFDESKQVDKLTAALRAHRYDATFLFVGDGPLKPELAALSEINDVRLLGTRPAEELTELHAIADVLLWGSVDVDYPGLVVMEAMMSGLPVVTTNCTMNRMYQGVSVEPDILGGPALTQHYPPTASGIDAAIRNSLEQREKLRDVRGAVRAFAVRRFGESNAEKLLDALASLPR